MQQELSKILQSIRQVCMMEQGFVPLHAPVFMGNEKQYVLDTIDSTFVSSVGEYVNRFEAMLCNITGSKYAIACANGTSALQIALHVIGVQSNHLVLTQSLSFVATANAIMHCGAEPIFLDVDKDTLGLCPAALEDFLTKHCVQKDAACYHRKTGKKISACVPMHSFGHPCLIDDIYTICNDWHIALVEDAAEALGSVYKNKHCGTFGKAGILSFNGNKIVTTGGGGAILTDDDVIGVQAKHLTTTAKIAHAWNTAHDMLAWNLRLPNINAALGCAQLEKLEYFLQKKRERACAYRQLFENSSYQFIAEPHASQSNYWLCSILAQDIDARNIFLEQSNSQDIMTRPAWELLHTLPMYQHCLRDDLKQCTYIANRLINLPSGVFI